MNLSSAKAAFIEEVERPFTPEDVVSLGADAKAAGAEVPHDLRVRIAARLAHAAFLAPDRIGETWDAITLGWEGTAVDAAPVPTFDRKPEPAGNGLWGAFWDIAQDSVDGKLDALLITQRTAALGAYVSPSCLPRSAEAALTYPGIAGLENSALPDRVTLEDLAACPADSLGREFHDLIVDNKFDLEVLDRDVIGLSQLPAPLAYLNTRILQAHDLWHIVAGYETTALHEVALSAFQMAQFGHVYSAQFLAVTAGISAIGPGPGWPILMTSCTTAWRHGRETPPMMLIDWESEWANSAEMLRKKYNIKAYDRPYVADLVERLRAA